MADIMKPLKIIAAVLAALLFAVPVLQANGENEGMITYLSDMDWTKAEIYSADGNGAMPARDENVVGEELWLYDMFFAKGVCLHAMSGKNAYIEVDIEGKGFRSFHAYAGTAESEICDVTMASVRFKFKADGKVVYKTDLVTPKQRPSLISFDVTDCKTLRIEMDDGGDGISGDWGALGGALFATTENSEEIEKALLADGPAETTAPPEEKDKNANDQAPRQGGCGSAGAGGAALAAAAVSLAVTKKTRKSNKKR